MFTKLKELLFTTTKSTSGPMSLNGTDLWKSLRLLLISLGAAAIPVILQWVQNVDFGMWTPIVVGLAVPALDVVRRFFADQSKV